MDFRLFTPVVDTAGGREARARWIEQEGIRHSKQAMGRARPSPSGSWTPVVGVGQHDEALLSQVSPEKRSSSGTKLISSPSFPFVSFSSCSAFVRQGQDWTRFASCED